MVFLKNQFFIISLYFFVFDSGVATPTSTIFQRLPTSCYKYERNNSRYRCSNNLKFNEKIQACDLPQNVNDHCNKPNPNTHVLMKLYRYNPPPPATILNDPECANVESMSTYHPHSFDCARFSVCYDSKKWYLDCPDDFYFDKSSQMCTPQEFATCLVDSRCTMDIDFLPHPTDCSKYIQCYFNVSYAQDCPQGMWFNSYTKVCTLPEDSDCIITEPPWALPNLRCRYDKKTNECAYGCRYYIHCNQSSNQGTLKACPGGTAYSKENQLCSVSNLKTCTDYGHTVAAWTTPTPEAPVLLSYGFPGCANNEELFPHPTDKSKFIECVKNRGFERYCPEGLIFSRHKFHCS